MTLRNNLILAFSLAASMLVSGCSEQEFHREGFSQNNETVNRLVPDAQLLIKDSVNNVVLRADGEQHGFYLLTGRSAGKRRAFGNGIPEDYTRKEEPFFVFDYLHLQKIDNPETSTLPAEQIQTFGFIQEMLKASGGMGPLNGQGEARRFGGTDFNVNALTGISLVEINWDTLKQTDDGYKVLISREDKKSGIFTILSLANSWAAVYESKLAQTKPETPPRLEF